MTTPHQTTQTARPTRQPRGARAVVAPLLALACALGVTLFAFVVPTTAQDAPGGILFTDAGAGGADVFVIQPDGSGRVAVTRTGDLAEAQPDWAPDRVRLAYTALDATLYRLGVHDLATGIARTITSGPEDFEPDWSPDGTRILFTSYFNRDTPNQASFIMTANPDGTAVRPVIALQDPTYYMGNPRWAPDGSRIAFTVGSARTGGSLYEMRADGTGVRRLFEHDGWDDIDPAWSPDGTRIAFASGPYSGSTTGTRHDVWLLDVAQSIAGTVIVDGERDLRRPSWSPIGDRLVFDARAGSGLTSRYTLHIAPALGGAPGPAVTDGREPDWAGAVLPTGTPIISTATPTATPPATTTTVATATPPNQTEIPPVPSVPPFPTIPSPGPTDSGPAPTFPHPTASATLSASPTHDTPAPATQVYLPLAHRGPAEPELR